jgi:hypothetical protein
VTLGVGDVEIAVTVETRGHEHRDACLRDLAARGFAVRPD